MTKLVETIHDIQWHRNGIGGVGFYAILFTGGEDQELYVATLYDDIGYCSVLRVPDLSGENGVTFGLNSWRGDRYEEELRPITEEWEGSGRLGIFSLPYLGDKETRG